MTYKDTVLPVMRSLREPLMARWGKPEEVKHKSASPIDVVTELDLFVEKTVSEQLAKLHPDIGFVGEEFGGDRTASRFWLMDPVDGTAHFVRGLPFSTSMIALIEDGQVNFGVVYDFVNDRMFWAERGKGAFCNDDPIRVSDRPLSDAYLEWEINTHKEENHDLYHRLNSKVILLKSICAGWEYAMVAAGKVDGRVCFDPYGKDYDYAPGSLLVSEAGGIVTNVGTTTYDYRNTSFLAVNPVIYKELTEGPDALFPVT